MPVAALAILTGAHSVFTQRGLFFSGTAVVTFGGPSAVAFRNLGPDRKDRPGALGSGPVL